LTSSRPLGTLNVRRAVKPGTAIEAGMSAPTGNELPVLSGHRQLLALVVNGERRDLLAPVHKTLLEVLREDLELTGTKHGCELGECGACAVLVDGEPILSCLALPIELQGRQIVTVEGLGRGTELHPLQVTFAELGAAQCGYCTPGFLITAAALLDRNQAPARQEIADALSGNLCRCTGYVKIFEAVELAADRLRGPASQA
jgi:aerobic-type carbon monoxide dehydrogenase small subunit (CoxS/CutS family)